MPRGSLVGPERLIIVWREFNSQWAHLRMEKFVMDIPSPFGNKVPDFNPSMLNRNELTEKNRVPFIPVNHVLVEVTEKVYEEVVSGIEKSFNPGFEDPLRGEENSQAEPFGSGVVRKLPPPELSDVPVVLDGKVTFPAKPNRFNLEVNDRIYYNFGQYGREKRYMQKDGRYYLFVDYYEILCVLSK